MGIEYSISMFMHISVFVYITIITPMLLVVYLKMSVDVVLYSDKSLHTSVFHCHETCTLWASHNSAAQSKQWHVTNRALNKFDTYVKMACMFKEHNSNAC